MDQQTFADASFEQYRKPTRRERFLTEMNHVVPWAELVAAIEPVYPKAEGPGRPPVGVERMLRLHCLQQWFNLSDPAVEEALYDSRAMRQFVGIDLGREPVPDETTICKFRHLLEAHQLGAQLFARIREYLAKHGLQVSRGTIVDATIISAPSSTKNRQKARDPEMHQTKKGNQWYFGMKAHIGVDVASGVVHALTGTAANEADINQMAAVLHGAEEMVVADAGYTGAEKRSEHAEREVSWLIAAKRSLVKALPKGEREEAEAVEHVQAQLRSPVEHPFHVVKNLFHHRKARYRGLKKNIAQLYTLFALANLVIVKKALRAPAAA